MASGVNKKHSGVSQPPVTEELRRKLLREGSLMLDVKVFPRSPAAGIFEQTTNGALKIKITAAPERGRANEEVCALLAAGLGVPKRNVQVVLGHTSQQKRVRVLG